jgi:hypothetical protein
MESIVTSRPVQIVIAALAALSIGSAAAVSVNAGHGGSILAIAATPGNGCGGTC